MYQVQIHTGKERGSGTDANVFIEIHGAYGDTGKRWLKKSSENRNKFEKGSVDTFTVTNKMSSQHTKYNYKFVTFSTHIFL